MIDSWETVGAIHAAARNLRQTVSEAQGIIDGQAAELNRAYSKIRRLEAELAELRGDRVKRHRAALLESLSQH